MTTQPYSAIHEIYEQRNLGRFRTFLSAGTPGKQRGSQKDKDRDNEYGYGVAGAGAGSVGAGPGAGVGNSFSRSPRFGAYHFDGSAASIQPSKDEINARDRWGRTVLHLIASNATENVSGSGSDFLELLLTCPSINVNVQDKENGWTALHRYSEQAGVLEILANRGDKSHYRAVYAGNLVTARRLLQHSDTETHIRDIEGLTAFDLLNSTLLGTNPADVLDTGSADGSNITRRELVTWGANRNFVLGLQGDSDRTFPERVLLERGMAVNKEQPSESIDEDSFEPLPIKKIAMEKLHSGLLTDEKKNNFRLCGFGSTTGRLGHHSQHPQFAFEPLRNFGQQTIADFALGQDHTIVCTDKGDVWTFGLNTNSVLGYAVESSAPRPNVKDEPVQATAKRLVGILKKEFVIGVAASRYHCAIFTSESVFTWGKNNGQLGYPANATPVQHTPRKVTSLQVPVKQICATEVATVCLLDGGEVFVLHRDSHFKISFPMTRFPSAMQVYRPPTVSSRPLITKVAGSGTSFIAVSNMGDVFSWQLDNPALELPSSNPTSGRDIKPIRIWEDRKMFTAVTDACIANDTIIISTKSGHVYVRSRKKELTTVKGFELRNAGVTSGQGNTVIKKVHYKFTRVSNLQRVIKVAVSSSGGFGAIRSDAPLLKIPISGETLSTSLLRLLPHYRRLTEEEAKDAGMTLPSLFLSSEAEVEDDEDESIEQDTTQLKKLCAILIKWDSTWSTPAPGTDILVVAGVAGVKIPAHSTILAARSTTLASVLQGQNISGISVSRIGANTLVLPDCSHISVLLLLHYLYGDNILAVYDARLLHKLQATFPTIGINISAIKKELQGLASKLKLPFLAQTLESYGKTFTQPSLSEDIGRLLDHDVSADVVLETERRAFSCHSVLLRSRCPFFEAMLGDPEWYASRLHSDKAERKVVKIDMRHIRDDILYIVLRHMYCDDATPVFEEQNFTKADEKIDFLMLTLSASNELLLDNLKAFYSALIRPLVNMQSVCSILCEAIFYEAAALQECCMQYICCNIETMLEQHLLDVLPIEPMLGLAVFCQAKQLQRLPRTARSGPRLAELRIVHADWLKELDLPRPTGSYRRYIRQNSLWSPKLSPVAISTSLRLSPHMLSSSAMLSPPSQEMQSPPSPVVVASAGPSPILDGIQADDGAMFDMDDLSLEDSSTPSKVLVSDSKSAVVPTSASKITPWQRGIPATTPTRSLRDIMAQTNADTYTAPRPSLEGKLTSSSLENAISPLSKLSQRDRKRQQQTPINPTSRASEAVSSMTSIPNIPWKPINPPAPWAPPVTGKERPTALHANNFRVSSTTPTQATPSPPPSAMRTTTSANGALPHTIPVVSGLQGPTSSSNLASAIGAPVITPTRQAQRRSAVPTGGVPETRSHDTPWVSYTTTMLVQPTSEIDNISSFASIQNRQANEREILRAKKGPLSMTEIQEEENKRSEEAAFLTWFEEESRRTQVELSSATTSAPQANKSSRGTGRGGPRNRTGHRGKAMGGRGRHSGLPTSEKTQPARIDD